MSDLFLDLRDKPRVVDFMVDAMEYAAPKDRAPAEAFVRTYEEGEKVATDKLADGARKLAISTWPARYAVRSFFSEDGRDEEWRRVLAAVRPSTAHLLKRLRQGLAHATVDEVLKQSDASVALSDGEDTEIAEVRSHLRQDYWREQGKTLGKLADVGETKLKEYLGRLKQLRDLAFDLPKSFQDEVFSKIARYEDRIFFEGEVLPLEILDEETKYYVEQKEIDPLEGEGRTTGRRKRPPEI